MYKYVLDIIFCNYCMLVVDIYTFHIEHSIYMESFYEIELKKKKKLHFIHVLYK